MLFVLAFLSQTCLTYVCTQILLLIHLQRICNFWLFHAIILSILDVQWALLYTFILFLGLTYQPKSKCKLLFFLPISVFHGKGISNGIQTEWNLRRDFFPKISFLAAKEEQQPPYGGPTSGAGAPPASCPPSGTVSRWFFFPYSPNIPKIFSVRFCPVWILSDMGFLRNIKDATNRNWH